MTSKPFANIKNDNDFCSVLKISPKQMNFICHAESKRLYSFFTIPKKDGTNRTIHAPKGALKYIQKRIAALLREYYQKPKQVEGMEPGTSIVTNAIKHTKKKYVFNIDLKDFYNQIHIGRIIGFFKSRLKLDSHYATLLAQLVTVDGTLPTGSPCSPVISNMLFSSIDKKIVSFLSGKMITYTRYADDLTFSFNEEEYIDLFFTDYRDGILSETFNSLFYDSGFPINQNKVRLKGPGQHHQVTGVKVNADCNLSRYFKHWIRLKLSSWKKYGIESVSTRYFDSLGISLSKDRAVAKMIEIIAGKISYFGMVRGNCDPLYLQYAERFNSLMNRRYFSLYADGIETIKKECAVFSSSGNGADSGSAFLYRKHVISCFHCHEIYEKFEDNVLFEHPDGRKFLCRLVAVDERNDIAIYKPSTINYVEIKGKELSDEDYKKTSAFIVGYPDFSRKKDFDATCIDGQVFSDRLEDGVSLYSLNTHVQLGYSGGPVIDKSDCCVIGMVVFGTKHKDALYNNGFLPIAAIDKLIDENC